MPEGIRKTSHPTPHMEKERRGRVSSYHGTYVGYVKKNNDAHYNGRLKVWIPEFSSRPEDEKGWFTVMWASPFAGATPALDNEKNVEPMEKSQTSYGLWMQPPDMDNMVLITFLNGDPTRGVAFACLFNSYMNHMVPGNASQPVGHHHESDIENCELPVSEYNKNITTDYNEDTIIRPVHHWHALGLKHQGLIHDEVRGITDASIRRERPSQVYGLLTPGPIDERQSSKRREDYGGNQRAGESSARMGGHSIVLDDNKDSEHVRIRTRSGAQLLLDETNGIVYLNNRDGTSWLQMDQAGRVDIYAAESISVRSEKDLNLRGDRDVNLEAGRNLSLKANKDYVQNLDGSASSKYSNIEAETKKYLKNGSQIVGEKLGTGGRVTIHSNDETHIISEKDYKLRVNDGNMESLISNNNILSVGLESSTIIGTTSYHSTGVDSHVSVGNEHHLTVGGDFSINALRNFSYYGRGDIAIENLGETIDIALEHALIDNCSVKQPQNDLKIKLKAVGDTIDETYNFNQINYYYDSIVSQEHSKVFNLILNDEFKQKSTSNIKIDVSDIFEVNAQREVRLDSDIKTSIRSDIALHLEGDNAAFLGSSNLVALNASGGITVTTPSPQVSNNWSLGSGPSVDASNAGTLSVQNVTPLTNQFIASIDQQIKTPRAKKAFSVDMPSEEVERCLKRNVLPVYEDNDRMYCQTYEQQIVETTLSRFMTHEPCIEHENLGNQENKLSDYSQYLELRNLTKDKSDCNISGSETTTKRYFHSESLRPRGEDNFSPPPMNQ